MKFLKWVYERNTSKYGLPSEVVERSKLPNVGAKTDEYKCD